MLSLENPMWINLKGNYSTGEHIAELLIRAWNEESVQDWADWYEEVFQELCHQYTLSEAAYAAVPHLVAIAAERPPVREDCLLLAGFCYACAELPDAPPIPSELVPAWNAAAFQALALLGQVLGERQPAEARFRNLLAALAALNEHFSLAFVLEALDTEIECPNCGVFIDPMSSSLNLLSQRNAGDV